jgi:hypothetical protein
MTAPQKNTRPSPLKRYGPLIGIVVVIAIVGIVIAVMSGGDDDKKASTGGGDGSADVKGLPVTYPQAKADGTADSIEWGPNCNTDLGTVKIPSVYAPSCVEPYDTAKGNGGETYAGVTADTINLVYYIADPKLDPLLASQVSAAGADITPDATFRTAQGFASIYEKYFELWGRKVNLIKFVGSGASTDAAAAKADAVQIASDYNPFAVIGAPSQTSAFRDELASRDILCLGACSNAVPEGESAEIGKGLLYWPWGPSPEQAAMLTGAMICSQFKNGNAVYGGDDVKNKKRVYGIAHYDTPTGDQTNTYKVLRDSLEDCGISIKTDVSFFLDTAKSQETARTTIAKLQGAGVTSIIFLGDPLNPIYMTQEATAQDYFPEWIIGPTVYVDTAVFGRRYDQKQWAHAFGIGLPATRADQASQEAFALYNWGLGENPPSNLYSIIAANVGLAFRAFQLAGPNLTAETVRGGFYQEPIRGGGPTTPRLSFGEHGLWPSIDNYGSDDATLIWWNPAAEGTDDIGQKGTGLYEYAGDGKRYTLKGWPTSKVKLFDESTSVTIFDTLPASDQPPDYPSPVS